MAFYLGIYIIILAILAVSFVKTGNKKTYYHGVLISLFILFILYGLREATGVDDLSYVKLFNIANNSALWIVNFYGIEQSYVFISKSVVLLGFNYQMVFLIYAFLSFMFIYLSLKELCEDKAEFLLAISSFLAFCFIMTITVMRQFLSCTMILYSVVLLLQNKNKKSVVMILLASLVHNGAIICLLIHFFVMRPRKINIKTKLILPLGAFLFGLSSSLNNAIYTIISLFFNKYVYLISSNYFGVTQETGNLIFVLLMLFYMQFAFQVIFKPAKLKEQSRSTDLMERGEMIFLSISFATISMGWIHRSSMYYLMFSMFFFITFYRSFPYKKGKALITTEALLFISFYFGYAFYYEQLNVIGIIPYSANFNIFVK